MMVLKPYTLRDGIPTYPDSIIKGLYLKMEHDKTAREVFFDGCVRTADDFLHMMKFGQNRLWVIVVDEDIVGIVWLNNFEARYAWFHFCFYSNFWGKDTVGVGKRCVLELLNLEDEQGYMFDMLCGLVPENNINAINWCHKMNFETLGRLPCAAFNADLNQSETGVIFYVLRGKYNG